MKSENDREQIRAKATESGWRLDFNTSATLDVFVHPDKESIRVAVWYRQDALHEASVQSESGTLRHAYVAAEQYRDSQLNHVLSWF